MNTDSLYLALSEHDCYDCIRPAMKKEWDSLRSRDWTDEVLVNSTTKFFPLTWCAKHKKHDRREPDLFKEDILSTEMICLCSITHCCYDSQSNKVKFGSKSVEKTTLEGCDDGPLSEYCKVFENVVIVTSKKGSFGTIHHAVATYQPKKRGLSEKKDSARRETQLVS